MSSFIFGHLGSVRIGAEGVGSYGSDPTLTSSDAAEVAKGAMPKFNPTREELDTLSPQRGGQELVTTDKTVDIGYVTRMRALTLVTPDGGLRPSVGAIMRGGGFIEAYDNNGGAGPYTLTYTLQSMPQAMDSCTVEDQRAYAANTTALERKCTGCRWPIKFSASRGQIIVLDFSGGKAKDYAETDTGSALPVDTLPCGATNGEQIFTLQGATLLLETVGGGTVYSGPLEAFEIDTLMEVVEVKDGTSSGLVNEVLLQPTGNLRFSYTVAEQLVAAFNARSLRDTGAGSNLHAKLTIPSLAASSNSLIFETYGSIADIEDTTIGGGATGQKINMAGLWTHASTPGCAPASPLTVVWQTTV